jgi:hypothetical protein
MAYFEVLQWYVFGGTDRDSENPQDNWSLSRSVNPGSPKYKAVVRTFRLQCSIVELKVNHPVNTRPPLGFILCEFVLFLTVSSCFSKTDFNVIILCC